MELRTSRMLGGLWPMRWRLLTCCFQRLINCSAPPALQTKGVEFVLPTDVVVADKFAADADSKVVPVTAIPDGWMVRRVAHPLCPAACRLLPVAGIRARRPSPSSHRPAQPAPAPAFCLALSHASSPFALSSLSAPCCSSLSLFLQGLDVGPESSELINKALSDCQTILWNGPMGGERPPLPPLSSPADVSATGTCLHKLELTTHPCNLA